MLVFEGFFLTGVTEFTGNKYTFFNNNKTVVFYTLLFNLQCICVCGNFMIDFSTTSHHTRGQSFTSYSFPVTMQF